MRVVFLLSVPIVFIIVSFVQSQDAQTVSTNSGDPAGKGRLIENWPYDRLFKAADLVVIGKPTKNSPCDDRTNDNLWKIEFEGVETEFNARSVLKGKSKETLTVLHFQLRPGWRVEDGPLHVVFKTKSTEIELKTMKVLMAVPEYMLFLKVRKDGRYEPVSGRTDPSLSVREMYYPMRWNDGKGPRP